MGEKSTFLKGIIDALAERIVVLNAEGEIVLANRQWLAFGKEHFAARIGDWSGINYLSVCDKSAATGDEHGRQVAEGIRRGLSGEPYFQHEYPCHEPDRPHWFLLQATPMDWEGKRYLVVSHQEITRRRMAEERVRQLARIDGLTGVANRRFLDEFLDREWRRCVRLKSPLSVLMVDIDEFKPFNDHYGHQAGDDCLIRIASTLDGFARRPTDLCARYGGEEFVLVLGNTAANEARELAQQIRAGVQDLGIPHAQSSCASEVTVSIGVASCVPFVPDGEHQLIESADAHLYEAKAQGRNRIIAP